MMIRMLRVTRMSAAFRGILAVIALQGSILGQHMQYGSHSLPIIDDILDGALLLGMVICVIQFTIAER